MRYLILIHSNPQSRQIYEGLSEQQRIAFGQAHFGLTDELSDSGELVVSEGLPDPSTTTRVSVRDGRIVPSPRSRSTSLVSTWWTANRSNVRCR